MIRRRGSALFAIAFASFNAGCLELPDIASDVCGNGIVEPDRGEDCDTYATEAGTSCRQPGDANQCRYACAVDAASGGPKCPAGWGCGTDGVCRQPAGTFEANATAIDVQATLVFTADFDGDGRADVLTQSRSDLRAHYFGPSGAVESTFALTAAARPAAVGELSDDTYADVTYPGPRGLSVLRGGADRTLAPTSYPALTIPQKTKVAMIMEDVKSDRPGDEPIALLDAGAVKMLAFVGVGNQPMALITTPYGPSELAGAPVIADLIEGTTSPCKDIALAWTTEPTVLVYSPCIVTSGKTDWNVGGAATTIALPADAGSIVRMFAADVNADGHVDLVVGGAKATYVAYSRGDGTFSPDPLLATASNQASLLVAGPLVAGGDLDGDGVDDFVGPRGVYFSDASGIDECPNASGPMSGGTGPALAGHWYCGLKALDDTWTSAIIGDFNANGIADLIAGSNQHADIDFYNGAGGGLFNAYRIPTDSAIDHLVSGDFDGDLVRDVAFDQLGLDEGGDLLSVSFGRLAGAPEDPLAVGRLDDITEIFSTFYDDQLAPTDGVADLGVVSVSTDEATKGTYTVAIVVGRGDRELESPFLFSGNGTGGPEPVLPIQIGIGEFTGDTHLDIGAVAIASAQMTQPTPKLWIAQSTGAAQLSGLEPPASQTLSPNYDFTQAVLRALDTGSGPDMLVAIAPEMPMGTVGPTPTLGPSALVPAQVANGAFVVGDPQKLDLWIAGPAAVAVADVDGDGHRDLVVVGTDAQKTGHVRVVRGGAGTAIDASQALDRALGADAGPPTAVATAQLDGDVAREIVVLTGRGAYRVDVENGALSAPALLPTLRGGEAITAGDVNGDGVDDVAIASPAGVDVFFAKPVRP